MEVKARRPSARQAMALCGALAPPIGTAIVAAATSLTPGYDPVRQTVSELAARGAPYPHLAIGGIVTYGVLVLPLGAATDDALGGAWGKLAWGLFFLHGVFVVLTAALRVGFDDALLGHLTVEALHEGAARVAYAALFALMALMPPLLWRRPGWRYWPASSLGLAALTAVCGALLLLKVWPDLTGALQRAFLAFVLLWVQATGLRLFLLARR